MAYDPNNIGKYYYCRKRFISNFTSIGDNKGQSIPLAHRFWTGNSIEIQTGETTLQLGTYIGFLGTEYKLFKDSGLSTNQTIKELYYALEAVNRLDIFADKKLDGYFVREDFNNNIFISNNPNINNSSILNNGYIVNSGETIKASTMKATNNAPMSRDHTIRILWGLLLAVTLLDDNVNFNQKLFSDRLFDFKEECRSIHSRIIGYINSNGWKIKDLNGNVPIGGNMRLDRRALIKSFSNINNIPLGYSALNGWGGVTWNGWMNGRISLEKQNLSGNSYRSWNRSWKYGYESYFLYYGLLVYNWPLGGFFSNRKKRKKILNQTTEFYLNSFPCKGNFNHSETDFSFFGWALSDRSERSIRDAYFGIHWGTGNFNSLDYLIMHNLYYLNNFKKLGFFPKFNSQDCELNCKYIDKNIMLSQINRVRKYSLMQTLNDYIECYFNCVKDCIKNCNDELNNCKTIAWTNYSNRRNRCRNFRWFPRRIRCRIWSWLTYLSARIRCTARSIWCKLRCSITCFATCYTKLVLKRRKYNEKLDLMSKMCK